MWVVTGKDKKLPRNVSVALLPRAVRSRSAEVPQSAVGASRFKIAPFPRKAKG